jgi:hypothetical protein
MFYYGINVERLFLRVDFRIGYHDPGLFGDAVLIHVSKPQALKIVIPIGMSGRGSFIIDEKTGLRRDLPDGTVVISEIIEAGIPWSDLGGNLGERVQFHLSLEKAGNSLASWPMSGSFSVVVPDQDFERRMWSV